MKSIKYLKFGILIISLLISIHCGLDGVDGQDGKDATSTQGASGVDGAEGLSSKPFRPGSSESYGTVGDSVIDSTTTLDNIACSASNINEYYQVKGSDKDGFYYCNGSNWVFGWSEESNDNIWPFQPNIPDINLRKCLNLILGNGIGKTNDLTIEELEKLDEDIECKSFSISNLEGVQHAINATSLNFADNNITNIPLDIDKLTNLTSLDLSENKGLSLVDGDSNDNDNNSEPLIQSNDLLFDSTTEYTVKTTYKGAISTVNELILTDQTNYFHIRMSGGKLIIKHNIITDINFRRCIHAELKASLPNQFETRSNISELTYDELELIDSTLNCEYRLISSLEGIGYLTEATSLLLGNNQIKTLPDEMEDLENLTTLNVENNNIIIINEIIGEITNLATLNISDNQIETLPSTLSTLIALTSLDISDNDITTLPSSTIKELNSLVSLDASNNEIETIPANIRYLTSLTSLDLSNNKIHTLPSDIKYLTSLTSLDLSYNQIESVPGEIGYLAALTDLRLNRNHIFYLPTISQDTKGLDSLTNLTKLYLDDNTLITCGSCTDGMNFVGTTTGITEGEGGLNFTTRDTTFHIEFKSGKFEITEQ